VVAIAIALGQLFCCLHSPAGAVALLGVIYKANLNFVFFSSITWFSSIDYLGNYF